MYKLLLIIWVLLMAACLDESNETLVETEFAIVLSDVSDRVEIDSVVVNITGTSIDTILKFDNAEGSLPKDRLQFTLTIPEGEGLSIEYQIYVQDESIKSGFAEYTSGNFDPLNTDLQESQINDSLLQILDPDSTLAKLKLSILSSNQEVLDEGDTLDIRIGFVENGSLDTLKSACPIRVSNSLSSDLDLDTLLEMPQGAQVESTITFKLLAKSDSLVEGQESTSLTFSSDCEGVENSNNLVLNLDVVDEDKVEINFTVAVDTITESDTSWSISYWIDFTPNYSRLSRVDTVQVVELTGLDQSLYTIAKSGEIVIDTLVGDQDTSTLHVDMIAGDTIIQDHRSLELQLNGDGLLDVGSQSTINLTIRNDDFKYYFIADQDNDEVHILDHNFQYIKSKSTPENPRQVHRKTQDSLIVVSDGGVAYWNFEQDTLILIAGGSNAYLEHEGMVYWNPTNDTSGVYITPIGGGALAFNTLSGRPWDYLTLTSSIEGVEAWYFNRNADAILVERFVDYTTDTISNSIIPFLSNAGTAVNHSNGKTYIPATNRPPCVGVCYVSGYVVEIESDSMKIFTPEFPIDPATYDQMVLKEPIGMIEDEDGSLIVVDIVNKSVVRISTSDGSQEVVSSLEFIASNSGLSGIQYEKTHVEILP